MQNQTLTPPPPPPPEEGYPSLRGASEGYSPGYHYSENDTRIQNEIWKKVQGDPYFATRSTTQISQTDMDHFPYTRFFRGVYDSFDPVIHSREAGYRHKSGCYDRYVLGDDRFRRPIYPNHCFQMSNFTVTPCYPEYLRKDSDKAFMDLVLNNVPANQRPGMNCGDCY